MKPLHIGVAVFNPLCLAALLVAFAFSEGTARAGFLVFAIAGGYFANLLTLAIAAILVMLIIFRTRNGQWIATFQEQ